MGWGLVRGAAACVLLVSACAGERDDGQEGALRVSDFVDNDGDGYSEAMGDCDDENRHHHPGALDPCDGIDQNCDGIVDDVFDIDRDGWTACNGDCRDHDPTSNPAQSEIVDGIDNDCDGLVDNNTSQSDDDGDGYSEDQGDCNDIVAQGGALIGPDAMEVATDLDGNPEGRDNDCDGLVDEAPLPCEQAPSARPTALEMVAGLGLCDRVNRASIGEDTDLRGYGLLDSYGDTYVPRVGGSFVALATGLAGDAHAPDFVDLDGGTSFGHSMQHPEPAGAVGCSSTDPLTVNDHSSLTLELKVPTNASSFSFDFNFMSAEFPEWVCTSFDDTFLAILESEAYTGNVSFDSQGNRMSINVGFFDVCNPGDGASCTGDEALRGTGYEDGTGGGTGWLTTTAPVVGGEKMRLTFIIFDEGDSAYDSAVLLDNFRWGIQEIEEPITVD